jgi:hypothetical protein
MAYNLQGGLQLVDLLIRKITGEQYQCSSGTALNSIDECEAKLQASLQKWGSVSNLTDNFNEDLEVHTP